MKKVFGLIVAASIGLAACNTGEHPGFDQNENGLFYTVYDVAVDSGDRCPVENDIITASISYGTEDSTFFEMPAPQQMMFPKATYPGDLWEGVALMTKGDSATFILNADDFFRKTLGFQGAELPGGLDSTSLMYCDVVLSEVVDQETAQKQHELNMAKLENEEIGKLQNYIKENNITVEPTESGLYFVRTEEGKGKKAENGKTMVMHYTGKFLDGKTFDSSLDRGEPFEFVLGQGRVIKGWDEGVAMMRVGDKATMVIPSKIAYGAQDRGPIPAYSSLVFEVELLDIK